MAKEYCTLTDQELILKAEEWIKTLINTGGRAWSLPVPAQPNKDVDLILSEVIQRFSLITKSPVGEVLQMFGLERQRQIDKYGYTDEHISQDIENYGEGELAYSAAAYLTTDIYFPEVDLPTSLSKMLFQWDLMYFKPTPEDRIKELVKAGAMITAEIIRLKNLNK